MSESTTSDIPTTGSERYCTTSDVSSFTQKTISSTSTPSTTDVDARILEAMEEIDYYCRHAWRSRTSTIEDYDYTGMGFTFGSTYSSFGSSYTYGWGGDLYSYDTSDRGRLYLNRRFVRSLSVFKVWNGATYDNWLTDKTEGRGSDYTLFNVQGYIMFGNSYPFRRGKSVQIQYVYGESTVPADIKRACIYLVAASMVDGDDRSVLFPEGTSNIPLRDKQDIWRKEAYKILNRHRDLVWHTG